jgi:hypothetical protein
MLIANAPGPFGTLWGASAGASYIHTVPVASQIGITNGAASYTDGFPPLTFTAINAGGVPPFGQDFNGALNAITASIQAVQAGLAPPLYNASFSGSIGGYPKGAVVQSLNGPTASIATTLWQSTADNNSTTPDTAPGNWVQVSPALSRGIENLLVTTTNGTLTVTFGYAVVTGTNGGQTYVLNGSVVGTLLCNATASGAGGLDTGGWTNNTSYFQWLIYNPQTGAAALLLSLSSTSPTMPAGYTAKCLLSFVRANSAASFLLFRQWNSRQSYTTSQQLASGTAGASNTVSTTSFVPSGLARAILTLTATSTGGTEIDVGPTSGGSFYIVLAAITAVGGQTVYSEIPILTNGSIAYVSSDSAGTLNCVGFDWNW